jgi:hypothetical protein
MTVSRRFVRFSQGMVYTRRFPVSPTRTPVNLGGGLSL